MGMLVLSRKPGETVVIGRAGDVLTRPIVVTCVEVTPGRSRLGFDAQKTLGIDRGTSSTNESATEDLGAAVVAKQKGGDSE